MPTPLLSDKVEPLQKATKGTALLTVCLVVSGSSYSVVKSFWVAVFRIVIFCILIPWRWFWFKEYILVILQVWAGLPNILR